MDEILDYAERRTRAALAELPDGEYEAEDVLEGGPDGGQDVELRVRAIVRGALRLDFSGSADQVAGNLNCPLSVTKSAAFFAVRVLTDPDAPPCAGAHRPIEVAAPEGCVLNARPPAAVAAGNVETSSRVADLVIEALAEATAGARAGPGDDEQLHPRGDELDLLRDDRRRPGRLPGRRRSRRHPRGDVEHAEHARRGPRDRVSRAGHASWRSGAAAAAKAPAGGDGVVREIEALEPMRFTLITERRRHAPRGRAGGAAGSPGRNLLNGEQLPPKAAGELAAGRPAADRDARRRRLRAVYATLITNLEFPYRFSIFGSPNRL